MLNVPESYLRAIEQSDSELMLQWRNLPEVRFNMYTQHEISRQEHGEWIQRTLHDSTKKYLMAIIGGQPSGVVGFYHINSFHRTADWAFYSGDLKKRGIGSQMEKLALEYAFETLALRKLSCEVLSYNYPVVDFHRKHGFSIEGIFRKSFVKENDLFDIYRLSIFEHEWRSTREVTHAKWLGKRYDYEFEVNEDAIERFIDLTGDNNPIHVDDLFAKARGFKGKIAHGFLTASVLSRILGTTFPGENTVYLSQSLRFKAPVYPGMKLRASLRVLSEIGSRLVLETRISSVDGENVLIEGEAMVSIR